MLDISDCIIYRSDDKDILLQQTRGISFTQVEEAVKKDKILALEHHTSTKFSHQYILVIDIKGYSYDVPFIHEPQYKKIFLKTIYPNRNHLYLIQK